MKLFQVYVDNGLAWDDHNTETYLIAAKDVSDAEEIVRELPDAAWLISDRDRAEISAVETTYTDNNVSFKVVFE